jgi:site-specific recombinase XerD
MELTTSRAVELFLASLRTRSAPANTIKAYRLDLQQFLKQSPTALSEVTTDVIRTFLDSHEQHKPATRRRHAATLQAFYADLDLTQDNEKIRVFGKGQRERTVLLVAAPESIRLLRRYLKHSRITAGSLFRGDPRYGGSSLPLDYSVLRKAWQRYCKQAGVQATIHQLRHSRATQLIQAGVPITTIRKQLGHRNLQSTLLYAEDDQATVKRDLLEYQRRKGKGV